MGVPMPKGGKGAVLSIVSDWSASDSSEASSFMEDDLARSGLTPADMHAVPVDFGRAPGVPAYLLPYQGFDYWRVRLNRAPDDERLWGKYAGPKAVEPKPYFPWGMRPGDWARSKVKVICEGEKKAAAMCKELGVPVVGIGGCWMWGHKNERTRAMVLLPDLQTRLKPGDEVLYVADRDILNPKKLQIGKAAAALRGALASLDVDCKVLVPPEPFKGADDWLVGGDGPFTLDELEEFAFNWFPISELMKRGVLFRLNKDGNVTSFAQALTTESNTDIACSMVLDGDPDMVTMDKYRGPAVDGVTVDGFKLVQLEVKKRLQQILPMFPVVNDGLAITLSRHFRDRGATNCVADYVRALKWDGIRRLDDWLPKVVKLADGTNIEYAKKFGRALICALRARILDPGCQQDYLFAFVGPQGIGKTTFFRILARFDMHDGYLATSCSALKQNDFTFGKLLKKAVVLDFDDAENLHRKEQGQLKQFVTRTSDEWREPYALDTTSEPRGFIVVASSNNRHILSDTTGNRRFMILMIDDIRGVGGPMRWSASLRDRLLAEANERPDLQENWWDISLDELNRASRLFMASDPVVDAIQEIMREKLGLPRPGSRDDVMYITPAGVSRWMDEAYWTPTRVGMRIAMIVGSPLTPFELGKTTQIRLGAWFEKLPEQVQRLWRPANKVSALWCYPVNERS